MVGTQWLSVLLDSSLIVASRSARRLWQTSLVPDEWSDRRDALPQGSVLRDYTIEEVLGHGGFGIVYKARHNELDHVVAIKEYLPSELAVREGTTIRARGADCETYFADGLRRFREEARALIDFQQHPSIVDCRDFFRANGTAYLVMEYVEGLPLSELLRQREDAGRPFTESDLLGIAIPLAEGLAHIHRAGVIHRDIKPANILVRSTDQQPVLIDFGAAKQAVAEHSRSLAPYTEGYAALEQVADGQLGPWTDLYGFGAVLWRMVAGGNRPWDPPNPVKVESRANAGLREAEDPLPTAKELGAGRFADRLLELIDGCLQLKDTDRIRESERVVQVLQGSDEGSQQPATAGQPAEGGHDVDRPDPVSEEPRTGRSSKGRSWKVVGVAAAIAVVVALAAVALIPRNGDVEMPDRWSFSIEAEPSTATVALLNGSEAYRPGMLLPPGQYEVEVGAPGFATHRERVTHSESETRHRVELDPLPGPEPEPVPPTPSDGTAKPTDSTAAEPGNVPNDLPKVSEPIAADPVVAKDQESTGGESQGTCSGGDFEDCFDLGQRYRLGLGVQIDLDRAAEFYKLACDGEHAEGCERIRMLGFMYRDGDGVPQDSPRAARLFELACNGGDARACWLLAYMNEQGNGVPMDKELAAQMYERACKGGNAAGCSNLGYMYEEGEGVPMDKERAAELYGQACDGASAVGCLWLGFQYRDGEGVPQDMARAAQLFGRACDGKDATGCRFLGFRYRDGEGVPQDTSRAAQLFGRACDGGDARACWLLAYMTEQGNGVPLDRERAAELYQQACDGGDASGCANLGHLYYRGEGVPLDRERAAELYQQACDGGDASGCFSLGDLYEAGTGVSMDRARAAELYEQACDGEDAAGCNNLGLLFDHGHGVTQNQVHAAELFHRACEGGSTSGCNNLGVSYDQGKGVRQDPARATELYRRACDGDNMSGCYNLGLNFYFGQGVGQDRSVAASLFRKACANGYQDACEKLETLGWR